MKIIQNLYMCLLLVSISLILTGRGSHIMVKQPALITAELGGNVTIECNVTTSISSYAISWTLGCEMGQLVNKSCRVTFKSLNHLITISNLAESDSGIYCCLIETTEGKLIKGNGTRLKVTMTPSSKSITEATEDANGARPEQVDILYMVIGLLICVIIVLLAVLIKVCHRGSPELQKTVHKEEADEADAESGIHYAEITKSNISQHPRTRQTEDTLIYTAIRNH
ncbi:uncharacterized protein [Pyxicephalus adspersus]|uniref:uncharacterized protein n=1 Tax=Pyxicephalus adspersus TaxID=30357 RepID=UPI003B5BB86F